MNTLGLYTTDFYRWTQQQINLLKTQQWQELDIDNLIEELATFLIFYQISLNRIRLNSLLILLLLLLESSSTQAISVLSTE